MPLIKMPKVGESKVRFTLYSSPKFRVFGDLYPGRRLFLHLDWAEPKATPSVIKEMIQAVAKIKIASKATGIEYLNCLVEPVLAKFESILGFQIVNYYIGDVPLIHMQQRTD